MTTTTARTPEEILAFIEEVAGEDWMGTTRGDLVAALPFQVAKDNGFLKEDATQEAWDAAPVESPAEVCKEYLTFAIGKALDHRGLSAGRSVDHIRAWSWLAGDEVYQEVALAPDYPQYGVPVLKAAAKWTGYPWPYDNEELERMSRGENCSDDCYDGCGT